MVSHDKRTQLTRRALLDAARALFAERGYADVAVTEIARGAGVTTGALYHQFGSKASLFRAVYAELVQAVWLRVLEARTGEPPSVLGDCEAYLDACADPAFDRITIEGPAVIGWDQVLDEAQAMIELSLTAARERGEIADVPIGAVARMLAAALKEAAVMIAVAEDPARARADARETARRLVSGLLGP